MKKASVLVTLLVFAAVSFTAFIVLPAGVRATTLYVGGAGPGNYTTIQEAIDDANTDDAVYVYGGTYYENVIVNKTLSLVGEDRDATVIIGNGTGDVVYIAADWANFTGFTVTGSGPNWINNAGVTLDSAQHCYLSDVNASGNVNGIYLSFSNNNTITNNIASSNSFSGIHIYRSDNNTVANNIAAWNNETAGAGVFLRSSDNGAITNNTISNNFNGFEIDGSNVNLIANNIVHSNSDYGMSLGGSNGNIIEGNDFTLNSRHDLVLLGSNDNTIASNSFSSKGLASIYLAASFNDTIVLNVMAGNGVYVSGYSVEDWNAHTIDTSNTVNGKPLYYWKNAVGGTIPSGAGQVILANCTNVIVENQDASNTSVGIRLGYSSNNVVRNNTVSLNTWNGIDLFESNSNTVLDNLVGSNTRYGIHLYKSTGNNITENIVALNYWYGVRLFFSPSSRVYHNSILGNAKQAVDSGVSDSASSWDNGYPSGGNYWNDYMEADNCSGPNQDVCPDPDGIGDEPYEVEWQGVDRYPLMDPVTTLPLFPPSAPQDLQATAGDQQVTLTWSPPTFDGGSPISNYRMYRGTVSGMETFLIEIGNVTSFIDTGLTNGQVYSYVVRAWNGLGEGVPSRVIAIPATIPGSPLNLTASAGNGKVTLNWDSPLDEGGSWVTNYTIYRGTVSGGEIFLVKAYVLTHVDVGLTNGVTYYYRVAAVNSVGEGPNSTELSATPTNQIPICDVTAPLSGVTIAGTYNVTGTANDTDGEVERVEVRIDDGPWIQANGTTTWIHEWDTIDVPEGGHTIHVRSYDGEDYSDTVEVSVWVEHVHIDGYPVVFGLPIWLWITAAVVIIFVMITTLLLLYKKRKRGQSGEPAREVWDDS